jgi:single-stranded-DNA-specific exonuclease
MLPSAPWTVCPELPLADLDAAIPELTRLQMQILANRGIRGSAAARAFVGADWHGGPPDLQGLDVALARLRQARACGERVVVFGDYDVDGITSCAVLLLALRAAGIDAHPYLPSRADDGRGLNEAAVRELAAGGARLIMTTDCGTSNVAEVELAAALGLDVVVTDHHPPTGALAPALAVVNPRQANCPSPEKYLAGVGVAFRVAEALLTREPGAPHATTLPTLLDLVAVGTIGDIVPLTHENWALAHAGLDRLNTVPRPGLRALAELAGLRTGSLTERDISFALAPRLNAAGRMGSPLLALQLLVTQDAAEAAVLAAQLQQLNVERQRATDVVITEARAQVLSQMTVTAAQPPLLVARGEGWPLGIIGLVAGRLAEEFGRPALAVSIQGDECRGSVRGPAGFNLVEALIQRADLFRRFGGHAQAAGFTLATADLDTLIAHLRAAAQSQAGAPTAPDGQVRRSLPPATTADPAAPAAGVAGSALAGELVAELLAPASVEGAPLDPLDAPHAPDLGIASGPTPLCVDCRLPLRRAAPDTYAALRALAPFGPGFPEPIFLASRVRLTRCWRSGPEGRNLRLALREGHEERVALWSRQGDRLAEVRGLGVVDVAYTLGAFLRPDAAPEYVLRIQDVRPAE